MLIVTGLLNASDSESIALLVSLILTVISVCIESINSIVSEYRDIIDWEEYQGEIELNCLPINNSQLVSDVINGNNSVKSSKGKLIPLENLEREFEQIWNTSIDYLRAVDPFVFETIVSEMYERLGYKIKVTSRVKDGGKDIILNTDKRKIIVECKRYGNDNKVSKVALQRFFAAISEEKADRGYFVTTSDFTRDSYEYTKSWCKSIYLVNARELIRLMKQSYNQVRMPEILEVLRFQELLRIIFADVLAGIH